MAPAHLSFMMLRRYSESELIEGSLADILKGCARGLKIPLTADSGFLVDTSFEKTQLMLIWDLGAYTCSSSIFV